MSLYFVAIISLLVKTNVTNLSKSWPIKGVFCHSAPVLWNALPKELRLYNSGHLGNRSDRSIHHLMSYCLLFYFTKSLNPIFFLFLFLHSLSAIWTNLLVLTLTLFIFIHNHFHYIHSSSFHYCFFVLRVALNSVITK